MISTRILAALVLAGAVSCCSPVLAQDKDEVTTAYNPRTSETSGLVLEKRTYGADLTYNNHETASSCCESYVLEVEGMKVGINLITTDGIDLGDIVSVTSVPEGYMAVPQSMTVDEESSDTIHIVPEGMS